MTAGFAAKTLSADSASPDGSADFAAEVLMTRLFGDSARLVGSAELARRRC